MPSAAARLVARHHYIHHIDTQANLNFLLPLCDWLFGTLKVRLTDAEQARWPRFEDAKRLPPARPVPVPVVEGTSRGYARSGAVTDTPTGLS